MHHYNFLAKNTEEIYSKLLWGKPEGKDAENLRSKYLTSKDN